MKQGSELVRATLPFAKECTWLSWWHVLSTGAIMVGAFAGARWGSPVALRIVCSVLAGLVTVRFFVIYHDQQHHAILARSRLAEWLMAAFGIFALSPSSIWRSSHNHHHKHNSKLRSAHIGSFPVMTRRQFEASPLMVRLGYLLSRHPLTIGLGYFTVFIVGMCVRPFLKHPRKHLDCLAALGVHVAIGTFLFLEGGLLTLVLVQTVPFLITFGIGSYLFYAQHNFPGVEFIESDGWAYERAALESSSYMKSGPVVAWITANIGYHHVHHLNHKIPFYRLPEVFAAIPELQDPKLTSLSPSEVLRCLRLKVWDAEARRMVGLGWFDLWTGQVSECASPLFNAPPAR
jgi:omega-6 fatty acid desaturase (delta-12 desaturase)